MAEIKIEMNRDYLMFDDGSVYNLGYWLVKRPYENNTQVDNIITSGVSALTTNVLCFVDDNGNFYGFDGVKTDVGGNTYECNPNTKSITITGSGGGVYTWALTNNQFAFLMKSPITTGEVYYVEGDYYIKIANFYQFDGTAEYQYSRYLIGQDFETAKESAIIIYNQFDTISHVREFITIVTDNKDDSGFYMAASVCKYDTAGYTGTFSANVMRDASSGTVSHIKTFVSGYDQVELTENTDPYGDGGNTSTGGGGGTFDPSGDTIDVPSLPNLSVLDTGFVSMWRPTKTELLNLYNYMWSSAFDIDSFKKIFANPIDAILGFGIVPLNPSTISGQSELKIGNIGTGINVSKINAQYYEIDCGSVDIPEYFGSYLDYEPYTTLDLFLPYIGSIPISVDDVRTNPPKQGSIKVIYHIDILSGSCVAFIRCKNKKGQWTTCYQYNGSVFTPLPITGNDFTSLYQGVLSAVGSAVGLATNIGSKNFGGAIGNVANIAGSVMNSKPTINRAGSMGSSNGRLGSQLPYLIMNLPKQAVAFMENLYSGYPSHITSGVGSLKDYTEFEKVYLDSIPATEGELQEIETLLTSGVIL